MEKRLDYNKIPWGYELTFNESCPLRERCLHYQAYQLKPAELLGGAAVYPDAWKSGECASFREAKLVQKAWGFSQLYKNVPRHQRSEARYCHSLSIAGFLQAVAHLPTAALKLVLHFQV